MGSWCFVEAARQTAELLRGVPKSFYTGGGAFTQAEAYIRLEGARREQLPTGINRAWPIDSLSFVFLVDYDGHSTLRISLCHL